MAAAEKLSITPPQDLAEMIRSKVRNGDYASDSDVVRDALRLWQRHQEADAEKRVWPRDKLERSLADPRPSLDLDADSPSSKGAIARNEAPDTAGGAAGPARHRRRHRAGRSAGGEAVSPGLERAVRFPRRAPTRVGRERPDSREGLRSFRLGTASFFTGCLTGRRDRQRDPRLLRHREPVREA